jgi:hypothetical protein
MCLTTAHHSKIFLYNPIGADRERGLGAEIYSLTYLTDLRIVKIMRAVRHFNV